MSLITVNEDKCLRDGLCNAACVADIISQPGEGSFPEVEDRKKELCIECGHCVAVCPVGALEHEKLSLSDCIEIDKSIKISPEAVEALLLSRRSIRNYKDKPVPEDVVERLLNAARFAPTGGNIQNVRYTVCGDKEKLTAMSQMVIDNMQAVMDSGKEPDRRDLYARLIKSWNLGQDPVLRHAPMIIMVHANNEIGSPAVNCSLAMSFIDLMAHTLGLGACYAGFFNTATNEVAPLKDALGVPENHTAVATLMLGYPKLKYQRVPPRQPAKFKWV